MCAGVRGLQRARARDSVLIRKLQSGRLHMVKLSTGPYIVAHNNIKGPLNWVGKFTVWSEKIPAKFFEESSVIGSWAVHWLP